MRKYSESRMCVPAHIWSDTSSAHQLADCLAISAIQVRWAAVNNRIHIQVTLHGTVILRSSSMPLFNLRAVRSGHSIHSGTKRCVTPPRLHAGGKTCQSGLPSSSQLEVPSS